MFSQEAREAEVSIVKPKSKEKAAGVVQTERTVGTDGSLVEVRKYQR